MTSIDDDVPGGYHRSEGRTVKVSYKVWFGVNFIDIVRCGGWRGRYGYSWQHQIKIVDPGGGIA